MIRHAPSIRRVLLACCVALVMAPAGASDVEVGIVESVSPEHLILQQKDGSAHIGFIAGAGALRSLKSIRKGQEVRAVFGSATDPRSKARIGTLLSIRVCAVADAECAADRKAIEQAAAKSEQASAAASARHQQCLQAMQATLEADPRHGAALSINNAGTASTGSDALAAYNKLSGAQRTCASTFAGDYHAAYMEACEQHHCGDHIAGGCAHLAGRSAAPAFHAKAIASCKTE